MTAQRYVSPIAQAIYNLVEQWPDYSFIITACADMMECFSAEPGTKEDMAPILKVFGGALCRALMNALGYAATAGSGEERVEWLRKLAAGAVHGIAATRAEVEEAKKLMATASTAPPPPSGPTN